MAQLNSGKLKSLQSTAGDLAAASVDINGTAGADFLVGKLDDDTINGLAGDDVLVGLAGSDILDGGAGADVLVGGEGDDVYAVDDPGDLVWENQNEGQDSVQVLINYSLPGNVEGLVLGGLGNLMGVGNNLNNTISGNVGNNALVGQAGSDQLIGGLGNDTYYVDDQDTITEVAGQGEDAVVYDGYDNGSYTLGDNLEKLTLRGGAQTGVGNNRNNTLVGNENDNSLDGKGGKDVMAGGVGDDSYVVDTQGDAVKEYANEGWDQVDASISYALPTNVEAIRLTGSDNLTATGNSANNWLTGNVGVNTLIGGKGNDWYILDGSQEQQDVVKENLNEGIDTVTLQNAYSNGSTYALPSNVENLVMEDTIYSQSNAVGNTLNNQLVGNQYDNSLEGKGGSDLLIGGAGDDSYILSDQKDIVIEKAGQGTDTVRSSVSYSLGAAANVENLELTGSANINGTGNALANVLTGNAGKNVLAGKGGNDNFVFKSGLANADTIGDFSPGADRISLAKSIFTDIGATGRFAVNDARFYFAAGATAAHDPNDRVVYNASTGALYYDADGIQGGVAPVQVAMLTGHPGLAATDIWIV